MASDSKFALVLTIIFLCLEIVLITHHEMYRDEFYALLVARQSPSFYAMCQFFNRALEIHPYLWYGAVYLLTYLTDTPLGMQLLHCLIAGLIVYIFSRCSPFTRMQKILFPFGYMIFYEYGAITKNYSIGVLFIYLFCCLYTVRYKRFIIIVFVLLLLANANTLGLAIAAVFAFSLLLECIFNWQQIRIYISRRKVILGFCVIIIGCIFSTMQFLTPYSTLKSSGVIPVYEATGTRMVEAVRSVAWGIFPIQIPCLHFWMTNALNSLGPHIHFAVSLAIILYICILLARKRQVLCIYVLSTAAIIVQIYLYRGIYRQFGYHYIILMASLWLFDIVDDSGPAPAMLENVNRLFMSIRGKIFNIVLLIQLLCSLLPVGMDLFYPFSTAKQVARWIKESNMDGWLIAGAPHTMMTAVAGYLNTDIYALELEKSLRVPGENILSEYGERTPLPVLFARIPRLRSMYGDKIVFIFLAEFAETGQINRVLLDMYNLRETACFKGSINQDEEFYVYLFKDAPVAR